jgi:hypothetical protein
VNSFLHYIGLSSSRSTAHNALSRLGHQAKKKIDDKISNATTGSMAPFMCIDDLDFEQKVHDKSLGHSSRMFHGTWGYSHHPNPDVIASVPSSDLTVDSFRESMSKVDNLQVTPRMFIPTPKDESHWKLVVKSQIAQALLEHVAKPLDSMVSIPTEPPAIELISADAPDITMLKLMVASDDSAQGAGEVFDSIIAQSKINAADFASRLQVIDGELGTCSNISTLQNQRIPSAHEEEGLKNILTLLGGAHTLWNISHALYTKHLGDTSDSRDCGSWRFLHGMGIPSQNVPDKKDYTLMLKHIKKIHRATLVHCIMYVY